MLFEPEELFFDKSEGLKNVECQERTPAKHVRKHEQDEHSDQLFSRNVNKFLHIAFKFSRIRS